MKDNRMILAEGEYYSLDTRKTQLNNNVLVVGASGSGKTRSIVTPNLLEATGSYIISDPKGNLYTKYKDYLKKRGYKVKKLDFTNPKDSAHYNLFEYIESDMDVIKIAHMLMRKNDKHSIKDPFWEEASTLLLQAIMAYLREAWGKGTQNLHSILQLVTACSNDGNMTETSTPFDQIMKKHEKEFGNSFAVSTYNMFRLAADATLRSILISVTAHLGILDTPAMAEMTSDDNLDIASVGKEKTALFVVVSDTDRSMDTLVNIFYAQAMNVLCSYADRECKGNRLPVPVRFILDDFATNCKIEDFPKMIASFRSREISTILLIQAESQLKEIYGYDGNTIIGNCDTYVYLGGNDVETAKAVAERCDVPIKRVLNMSVGTNWIFRRGQTPVNGKNLDLEKYIREIYATQKAKMVR